MNTNINMVSNELINSPIIQNSQPTLTQPVIHSKKRRLVDQQSDVDIAERYRLAVKRKNEKQRLRYHDKKKENGERQQQIKRQEYRTKRRGQLLELALCKMILQEKTFTNNNDLINYMVEHVYKTEDKGCHINAQNLREYRQTTNINEKLTQLKDLFQNDRITFDKHIAELTL